MARGRRNKPPRPSAPHAPYHESARESAAFDAYYQAQRIVDPAEWDAFVACLRSRLPTTFRVAGFKAHAQQLNEHIKANFVPALSAISVDDEPIEPPHQLSWYPDGLGWQLNASKAVLRKHPAFNAFHRFLMLETDLGNISRQEAVSMIPPLFLDVQPHHWVLDMCAAPGSKTAQLVEALHAQSDASAGIVVANDASRDRAYTLIHQLRRLQSPCVIVTNHEGQHFPSLRLSAGGHDSRRTPVHFDRILCDVPCSGDGTLRKNAGIWESWSVNSGHGLHCKILERGCQLLKPGGRLVYSTCSMNPIENEAVVASILRAFPDTMRLVDVSAHMPELKRLPGMATWKVLDKEGQAIEQHGERRHGREFGRSYFPPTDDELASMHLPYCMRVLPHMQDTGGFFIAVLEKTSALRANDALSARVPAKRTSEVTASDEEGRIDAAPDPAPMGKIARHGQAGGKGGSAQEEPFILLDAHDDALKSILDYFGIHNLPRGRFLSRANDYAGSRNLYFVAPAVEALIQSPDFGRLKLINTGTKVFVRTDAQKRAAEAQPGTRCNFRLHADGIDLFYPHMSDKRVLSLSLDDIKVLLGSTSPLFSAFSSDAATKLEAMDMGSCLVRHDLRDAAAHQDSSIIFPAWRAAVSLGTMLPKEELTHLRMRLGLEASGEA